MDGRTRCQSLSQSIVLRWCRLVSSQNLPILSTVGLTGSFPVCLQMFPLFLCRFFVSKAGARRNPRTTCRQAVFILHQPCQHRRLLRRQHGVRLHAVPTLRCNPWPTPPQVWSTPATYLRLRFQQAMANQSANGWRQENTRRAGLGARRVRSGKRRVRIGVSRSVRHFSPKSRSFSTTMTHWKPARRRLDPLRNIQIA